MGQGTELGRCRHHAPVGGCRGARGEGRGARGEDGRLPDSKPAAVYTLIIESLMLEATICAFVSDIDLVGFSVF